MRENVLKPGSKIITTRSLAAALELKIGSTPLMEYLNKDKRQEKELVLFVHHYGGSAKTTRRHGKTC